MRTRQLSMERIGTPLTSKENRKVFKKRTIDSDSESSANETCPKISKSSSCLASKKILNLITSSPKSSAKVSLSDLTFHTVVFILEIFQKVLEF